ncbi:hypothetical protein KAFR_0A04670 [Kazachstania africana CBS 2517]|uniref:DASH complex subunit DUO1 n=1 Tax=Kazachstania africana (strain ATCC 22294 / BCRC 22015 / CBS 2517 / CECT 1963 / NBRC 1671 / NRRL Y-8276) TaxID=1071382 RepID=H2ANF2_KAZAF|nr:hypothetical protein KAFR_0A04670 [Kazachstania africana CBS 2517]CCF55902.1 hypothetical protein KAFR_0A04670 [Kazachstania africana CBS 2517]
MEPQLDDITINKLIPQIFDQMRSNFDLTTRNKISVAPTSAITTQSLLQELESLDKIIDMIDNIDKVLAGAAPKNIARIHEVCKSTNTILDSWINIQSQAGYIHRLMNKPAYVENLRNKLKGADGSVEQELNFEVEEVERLKQEIERQKQKQILQETNTTSSLLNKASFRRRAIPITRNAGKNIVSKSHVHKREVPSKSTTSGIPTLNNKTAASTIKAQRKLFR